MHWIYTRLYVVSEWDDDVASYSHNPVFTQSHTRHYQTAYHVTYTNGYCSSLPSLDGLDLSMSPLYKCQIRQSIVLTFSSLSTLILM